MSLQVGAILHGIRTTPWGAGSTVSVTGSSSSATDVSGTPGAALLMTCDVPFHIRWGTSSVGSATTGDQLLPANTLIRVDVPSPAADWGFFRVIREGSTSGTLYYVAMAY